MPFASISRYFIANHISLPAQENTTTTPVAISAQENEELNLPRHSSSDEEDDDDAEDVEDVEGVEDVEDVKENASDDKEVSGNPEEDVPEKSAEPGAKEVVRGRRRLESQDSTRWQASAFNSFSCTLLPVRGGSDDASEKAVVRQIADSFYQLAREKELKFQILSRQVLQRCAFNITLKPYAMLRDPLKLDEDKQTVLASPTIKLGFVRKNWKERWLVLRNDGASHKFHFV